MTKTSDITSKSLISLLPNDWVRWATNVEDADNCEVLNTEFQLISRNTDALVLVNNSSVGKFLTLFEIQTRYSLEMPERMTAYAAFARERYRLPVVPVLVNILPYGKEISNKYESEFLGIRALQDYRVINLWEVNAEDILTKNLSALIPFIPTMKGGKDVKLLQKAQMQLELDEDLQGSTKLGDLEVALRIFAKLVLGDKANDILRWTMIDLIKESPYYQELIEQGLSEGRQQGLRQGLQQGQKDESAKLVTRQLTKRFGDIGEPIETRLRQLSLEQTEDLAVSIFDFNNLDDVQSWLTNVGLGLEK
jgi:predicted transposase YdaD